MIGLALNIWHRAIYSIHNPLLLQVDGVSRILLVNGTDRLLLVNA